MALRLTPNPSAAGRLSIAANQAARMSSIVTLGWDYVTGKPSFTPTYTDAEFILEDDGDTTKKFQFQLSSISASTTRIWSIPNVSDTFLGLTSAQSPTNKTFDNTNTVTLKDTLFTLQDDGDTTKQARFQLSGITTATTRTYTLPNASGTLLYSGGDAGTPSALVGTNISGTAASLTAGNANNIAVAADSTNSTYYLTYVSSTTGNLPAKVNTGISINPSIPSMSVGGTASTGALFYITGGGSTLTGTNQIAFNFQPTFSSAATANGFGIYVKTASVAASYTMTAMRQVYIDDATKGAASTITTQYQLYIVTPTVGATNYAIYSAGGRNFFGGGVAVGTDVDPGAGAVQASGFVKSTSATAGVGYGTGAGGTQTQSTNKSTTVVLNTVCGAITMNNAALNAGTIVSFTLTNSAIAATDVLVLNHISGGTPGSYTLNARAASGSATIDVRNNTGGSLSEAIVIQFAVIKGVNA